MGKIGKRTKKFAASGGIKKAIDSRRKHQQATKQLKARQERRAGRDRSKAKDHKPVEDGADQSEEELPEGTK